MEILLAFGLPLVLGAGVFMLFARDVKNFRDSRKLKIGELEALLKRHRLAAIIHFLLVLLLIPSMILFLENYAVLGAILLAIIFLGHVTALARFSRPIILSLHIRNEYFARLQDLPPDTESTTASEEEMDKSKQI